MGGSRGMCKGRQQLGFGQDMGKILFPRFRRVVSQLVSVMMMMMMLISKRVRR